MAKVSIDDQGLLIAPTDHPPRGRCGLLPESPYDICVECNTTSRSKGQTVIICKEMVDSGADYTKVQLHLLEQPSQGSTACGIGGQAKERAILG